MKKKKPAGIDSFSSVELVAAARLTIFENTWVDLLKTVFLFVVSADLTEELVAAEVV
jgi:hypothetical protein